MTVMLLQLIGITSGAIWGMGRAFLVGHPGVVVKLHDTRSTEVNASCGRHRQSAGMSGFAA